MYQGKFFRYATGLILLLLILFLLHQIGFLFVPFMNMIGTLFFPILLASIFYYILRPVVHVSTVWGMPRTLAILIIYGIILLLILIFSTFVGPIVVREVADFKETLPERIATAQEQTKFIFDFFNFDIFNMQNVREKLTSFVQDITSLILQNIVNVLTTVTGVATVIFVFPFVLFYFLKDDAQFTATFLEVIPRKYRKAVKALLEDIDAVLAIYIRGQFLVSCVVGLLVYIGYIIIGLKYALIFALFAVLLNIIPFFGSLIAVLPALLIGLTESVLMGVKVILVMITAQQIEGNFVSPQILGKRLDLHPLTVILLLLAAGFVYGFIGLLLAVPVYVIFKVVLEHFIHFYYPSEEITEKKEVI
jgi:predicted PurR-regulated permease PerM